MLITTRDTRTTGTISKDKVKEPQTPISKNSQIPISQNLMILGVLQATRTPTPTESIPTARKMGIRRRRMSMSGARKLLNKIFKYLY